MHLAPFPQPPHPSPPTPPRLTYFSLPLCHLPTHAFIPFLHHPLIRASPCAGLCSNMFWVQLCAQSLGHCHRSPSLSRWRWCPPPLHLATARPAMRHLACGRGRRFQRVERLPVRSTGVCYAANRFGGATGTHLPPVCELTGGVGRLSIRVGGLASRGSVWVVGQTATDRTHMHSAHACVCVSGGGKMESSASASRATVTPRRPSLQPLPSSPWEVGEEGGQAWRRWGQSRICQL